jgi:hypothetical protein
MRKIRLDIGGPKGNAWYIMGTVGHLCRQMGLTSADAEHIASKMRGDSFKHLGGPENTYEQLLEIYLEEFPFVELYATHDLGISEDLYTIDDDPEVYEL